MKQELASTKFHRQLGIVNPELLWNLHVRIVGVGGIGSAVALILAKMGVGTLEYWDPDKVEEPNLPNQFYKKSDIGACKVDALTLMLAEFSDAELIPHPEAYDTAKVYAGTPDIVICAVDSMDFRKKLWERNKNRFKPTLYLETRMGGEEFRIYALSPLNSSLFPVYESTLYTEKEASTMACTEKAIMYNVMMIASLVGSYVKMFVTEGVTGVPYETLGNILNTMFITTKAEDAIEAAKPPSLTDGGDQNAKDTKEFMASVEAGGDLATIEALRQIISSPSMGTVLNAIQPPAGGRFDNNVNNAVEEPIEEVPEDGEEDR